MPSRRTQTERSAGTTADLLAHATEAFGVHGYDRVSVDDVAAAAGVTKGAVYHHFGGKKELFLAVYTAAQERVAAAVSPAPGSAWERLEAGVAGFLAAVAEPRTQRILVVDGPRVLDRATIREVEERYSAGLLRRALAHLRDTGELAPGDDGLRTRLIIGALCEAATTIAESPDPGQTLDAAAADASRLLSGLRGQASNSKQVSSTRG